MNTDRDRIVTFRLTEGRYRQLSEVSVRSQRSVSGTIRVAIERYLDGPAAVELRRLSDDRSRKLMEGL